MIMIASETKQKCDELVKNIQVSILTVFNFNSRLQMTKKVLVENNIKGFNLFLLASSSVL